MAFSNTHAAAEYVSQGAMGARGIYSTKRKYSLSDKIVWQARADAIFDNILRQELQVITVDDPEPKLLTKQEAPIKFNLHSDGTTSAGGKDEDTVRISDTLAVFLQTGDQLSCADVFCDSDGAAYSTDKYDTSSSLTLFPEQMIVKSVTLSGAASGIASVVVKRGNGYEPTSSVTTLLTEYKLVKMTTVIEDGGDAVDAIWHEPNAVQNYCQLFSKTWQETETETNMNVYGKEDMTEKGRQKRKELMREIDGALLFGRKFKDIVNGQNRWFTGGIAEYVANASTALDGTSRFLNHNGAFDLDTFYENMEIAFRYGSAEKTAFCGGKFFTVLRQRLEKYITMNDGLSKKWGWNVYDIDVGPGTLHLVKHPLLREMDHTNKAWAYDMIGVDLAYVWLMVMKGMDIGVKTGVEDNDEHTKKNEIYGQLGLRRAHPSAHFIVYGITG